MYGEAFRNGANKIVAVSDGGVVGRKGPIPYSVFYNENGLWIFAIVIALECGRFKRKL